MLLSSVVFRVVCPDYVGDVFVGFDCLVVASHEEGFAMAILEAFLAGVPVVATPVGAVPETEAVYGPLVERVPPDPTPEQLAAAIAAATGLTARERASAAREIAWNNHSAARMAALWERFLFTAMVERQEASAC
jgi:glycosyltransferase involved in cell wall biosynthesis